jgi:hypothetical protein
MRLCWRSAPSRLTRPCAWPASSGPRRRCGPACRPTTICAWPGMRSSGKSNGRWGRWWRCSLRRRDDGRQPTRLASRALTCGSRIFSRRSLTDRDSGLGESRRVRRGVLRIFSAPLDDDAVTGSRSRDEDDESGPSPWSGRRENTRPVAWPTILPTTTRRLRTALPKSRSSGCCASWGDDTAPHEGSPSCPEPSQFPVPSAGSA